MHGFIQYPMLWVVGKVYYPSVLNGQVHVCDGVSVGAWYV